VRYPHLADARLAEPGQPGQQVVASQSRLPRLGAFRTEHGESGPGAGHGDRPEDEHYSRIAAENQARVAAGEELAPLIASFQALVARQTVPEWRAALDAVQQLDHVGTGPAGYWGVSLGCGVDPAGTMVRLA